MSLDLANIGLGAVRRVTDLMRAGKADSLIDYTKAARVEPIVLIDSDAMQHEAIHDVQQSLLSIFAGYYLQAVELSATIGRIDVMRHMERLNPNRDVLEAGANTAGWIVATESDYRFALPTTKRSLALEALNPLAMPEGEDDGRAGVAASPASSRDNMLALKELANLSVGKQLAVELSDGNCKSIIHVNVRLLATEMPSSNLVHILAQDNIDISVKERFHAWKAGRLSFIGDLILCNDLVDAHRKNLMADKDGVYKNILKRQRGNQLATLVSGNPSVATASNMVIITNNTAAELELEINGRLKDHKVRDKLFKETTIMIMVVINKDWNNVTFYHRGIPEATQVSMRDLRNASKGDGPNISDILAAYKLGTAPSL